MKILIILSISVLFLAACNNGRQRNGNDAMEKSIFFQDTTRNIYSGLSFNKNIIYYTNYGMNKEKLSNGLYEYRSDLFLIKYSDKSIKKYSERLYKKGFVEEFITIDTDNKLIRNSRFIQLGLNDDEQMYIKGTYIENGIVIDSTYLFDDKLNLLVRDTGEFVFYQDLNEYEHYFLQTRVNDTLHNTTYLGNIMFSLNEGGTLALGIKKKDVLFTQDVKQILNYQHLIFAPQLNQSLKIRKSDLFSVLKEIGYSFKSIPNVKRNPFLKLGGNTQAVFE